ncbi:helix-turn-helix transcriptional regulator [Paraburkholderia sp. UCT31]|uniref:helix-turn-helix domain-containing protein n=1 Tax=Paraburkholderia sp. UCT31 TaxID=2615209 RepID=UPI0016567B2F|nr:helix-turn-helix transcriptional regulator [Paraburkholderia sp. UCT31]MBC8737050.1 helix-turn-helix transcriptional regulator [Paraburkholderia sp. UCT31]
MSTPASIGTAIRAAREQKHMSARELLERTGLSHVTLRELENGLGNSRLSTLLAVCDALGLEVVLTPREVSGLIEGDDSQRPTELSELLQKTRAEGLNYADSRRKRDTPK